MVYLCVPNPWYLEGVLSEKYALRKPMYDSVDVSLLNLDFCRLIMCQMPPSVGAFVPIQATIRNYFCNVRVTLEIYKLSGNIMQMTIDMTEKAEIWYGIKIQKKWRTGSLHYRGIQFSREQLNKSARQYRIKNKKSRAD